MKNTRERSLEVRKKAKEALNEITTKQDWEFREYYNDLYGRKNGYEVRRLKGTITNQHLRCICRVTVIFIIRTLL